MDDRRGMMDQETGSRAHRPSSIVHRLLLLFIFLASANSMVFAEWYKDYETALDQIKKGQFDAAIPHLQASINQKPDEGASIKFYGMKFADYFPHYYLGFCYFNLKDYPDALREFEQSERYGAIYKKRELADKIASLKTLSQAQITAANPPVVAKNNPPPVQQPAQQQTPASQPPAQQPMPQPSSSTTQNQKKEPLVTNPPQIKNSTPPIVTPQQPVNMDAETARFMVKKGAKKYFEGDYDGAVSLLTSAIEASPNSASSYFLLGCAYSAKYLLSGSHNQEYFKNATLAFQKIKKIDPKYRLKNGSFFSPAILEIYAKTS